MNRDEAHECIGPKDELEAVVARLVELERRLSEVRTDEKRLSD